MAKKEMLIPFILKWEGGYVHHKNDKGGATNKGVTFATWEQYCKRKGKHANLTSLRHMTNAEWEEIFTEMYWEKCGADNIESQRVANLIVDWAWMSGLGIIKRMQRLVGMNADGIVGPKTLAAINGKSGITLMGQLRLEREAYYRSIVNARPSQKVYLQGWLNRLDALCRL